jgi:hypothetical protein
MANCHGMGKVTARQLMPVGTVNSCRFKIFKILGAVLPAALNYPLRDFVNNSFNFFLLSEPPGNAGLFFTGQPEAFVGLEMDAPVGNVKWGMFGE